MKRIQSPVVGSTIDHRTALDKAKDELTESLREKGDATTVAIVIRFVDQMRDITDRVLFRDYSAERVAFGRVATELDAAALRAGLCHTEVPVAPLCSDPKPDDLTLFG